VNTPKFTTTAMHRTVALSPLYQKSWFEFTLRIMIWIPRMRRKEVRLSPLALKSVATTAAWLKRVRMEVVVCCRLEKALHAPPTCIVSLLFFSALRDSVVMA
jgi:hypothetical protein